MMCVCWHFFVIKIGFSHNFVLLCPILKLKYDPKCQKYREHEGGGLTITKFGPN
jgi:hypothetical protein